MQDRSWSELTAFRARVRGCLLGGALGDALGNPVEFLTLAQIRARYGETGVTGLVPDADGVLGRVTDDTQLTLFSAEGCLNAFTREQARGIGGAATALVREAYLRWLDTQRHPAPPPAGGARHRTGWLREQQWLYARRSPGNACLTGLREEHVPRQDAPIEGKPGPVNPASKGCGTVMRAAPFGFFCGDAGRAFERAARCAQITHGHPTGYYAAGALAAMIRYLADGDSPHGAVLRALELLARYPGHEETTAAVRKAVDLAADGEANPAKLETLGAGWIAEEALAIAVYAALAPTRQIWGMDTNGVICDPKPPRTTIERAYLLAVNHSGDSDSTGAICGNLLGAHHGDVRLPQHWLAAVEGRGTIASLADDCAAGLHPGEYRPWDY